jgi:hypothetical protein
MQVATESPAFLFATGDQLGEREYRSWSVSATAWTVAVAWRAKSASSRRSAGDNRFVVEGPASNQPTTVPR